MGSLVNKQDQIKKNERLQVFEIVTFVYYILKVMKIKKNIYNSSVFEIF